MRIIIGLAKVSGLAFAALKSLGSVGRPQFEVTPYSPAELEEEFLIAR